MKNITTETGSRIITERADHCLACDSKQIDLICKAYDRLCQNNSILFEYSRCQDCSSLVQSLRPAAESVAAFYGADYGPYLGQLSKSGPSRGRSPVFTVVAWPVRVVNRLFQAVCPDKRRHFLTQLYSSRKPKGVFLDYGCGSAQFLDKARGMGWETVGMDFTPDVAERVKAAGHKALVVSDEAWDEIEDNSVGLVRMNHVIEHLFDPPATLAKIYEKMAPGATLHIATPNAISWSFQIFRERWFSLDCPRHIGIYSPRGLEQLLRGAGFDKIAFEFETLTKDFSRSFFYYARDHHWPDFASPISDPDKTSLKEFCHLPARMAARLGRSDRMHVVVTK